MKTLVSHRAHDARCEANSEKMLAEAIRLADLLPHGSGIDYVWKIRQTGARRFRASNSYHAMDEYGGYCCVNDFTVIIDLDEFGRFKQARTMLNRANRHAHNWDLLQYLDETIFYAIDMK
jgi:hypothetical protein